jgi:hypothetical protein
MDPYLERRGFWEEVHTELIVVSRSWQRPRADLYLFGVRELIPAFPVPLRQGEVEPGVPLNQLLHEAYEQGGFDLRIDYTKPAEPPLSEETDAARAASLRSS